MKNLDSLTIHQFRGLRDVELKDLGQINLFVGINNSGKTTVLEALSIYCRPRDIRNWLSIALQREKKPKFDLIQSIDAVLWMFPYSSTLENEELQKHTIVISSSGLFSVKKMIATCKEIEVISLNERNEQEFENDDNPLIKQGIDLKIELFDIPTDSSDLSHQKSSSISNFKLVRAEHFNLSRKDGPNLKTSLVTPSSHRSEIGQFQLLSEATFQNFKFDVVKLLQQMDNNISDIVILLSPGSRSSGFNIYIQHQKMGLAPVSTFGDGVRRLLHIALKLASVKGGILLIDELEVTIHTEALINSFKWLVKWCIQMDVQLFATTHSLQAVDALLASAESDSDLVLYRLEPNEPQIRVVRHDGHRLRRLREELGQEVRW